MTPTQPPEAPAKVIDLTGLPDKAIEAVRAIVEMMRQQVAMQPPAALSAGDWDRQFDDWMKEVAARASRYPDGFVVDDSREAMYEGRGE
jgi:hypothetical protein